MAHDIPNLGGAAFHVVAANVSASYPIPPDDTSCSAYVFMPLSRHSWAHGNDLDSDTYPG